LIKKNKTTILQYKIDKEKKTILQYYNTIILQYYNIKLIRKNKKVKKRLEK